MAQTAKKLRNSIAGWKYQHILKPLFFRMDPEYVHDRMIANGVLLGKTAFGRWLINAFYSSPQDPRLVQTIAGVTFQNPIGLAGGFDKNAQLTDILPSVGFGFMEVGSITAKPYSGNPGRHLWRLPKTQSLVVYYGLKNNGAEVLSKKLAGKKTRIPLGMNIAKTNNAETCTIEGGVADYVETHQKFQGIGDYETINVSCPNAFGGQPFHEPAMLEALLKALDLPRSDKPTFVKISPDLTTENLDEIIRLAIQYGAKGIICTNLTKKRDPSVLKDENVPDVGGLSGKAVDSLSDKAIEYIYKKAQGKLVIIALGGVFTAEDAYRKIKLGASLVQLITGMIYRGPQVISEINCELLDFLERDGYKNISEAVGTGLKNYV